MQVIQHGDPTGQTLVARHPRKGTLAVELGSRLVVEEGQEAIFLRDGRALDAFGPGRHTMATTSLPLLARYLESLGFDFHSLQDALDQAAGRPSVRGDLEGLRESLEGRLLDVERRLSELERQDGDT